MQKGFAPIFILVGILVIFLIAGGAYYLGIRKNQSLQQYTQSITPSNNQPKATSDSTVSWKIYENKEAGVSFKYPSDWMTKPYQFDGDKAFHALIELAPISQQEQGPAPGPLTFAYWDNPDNLSLDQFEKKYTGNSGFGPGIYSPKAESKTIAGIKAYYQKDSLCEPVYCDKYIIPYKNKILEFVSFYNTAPTSNDRTSQREIFDQVLSTLKFLDSSSISSTEWKTFTTAGINSGLSLKYPSNWVTPENMFISQKTFVAGEQERSKVYNIIEIQKYSTQLYVGYTNSEWFNKISNLTEPMSDQRETRTKITSGGIASGESYVIFKDEPSATAQSDAFKQVKAYILKDQIIYQLTLDLYDSNGLEIFKKIVSAAVIN